MVLLRSAVAPVGGDCDQKNCSVCFDLSSAAFPSGAPRMNHTKETRHLAGSTQGVGSAGPRESVSAGLRTYGLRVA